VTDFVAIIAGFEARSVFGRAQGPSQGWRHAGSPRPRIAEKAENTGTLSRSSIEFFDTFCTLGQSLPRVRIKSSTSPLEGQVLETGTG
jgi:hypothetical protein